MDRHEGLLKRQMENDLCPGKCQSDSGDAAENGQNETLREDLADLAGGRRAECRANRCLQLSIGGADEHEVGNICAGDGEDQSRNPHQKMQAGLVFVAQRLNPSAAGREMQRLFRDHWLLARLQLGDRTCEPLLKLDLHVRFNLFGIGARCDASDNVKPVLLRKIQDAAGPVDERLSVDGDPDHRRILKAVPEKIGRRDSDDGERFAVHHEGRADD